MIAARGNMSIARALAVLVLVGLGVFSPASEAQQQAWKARRVGFVSNGTAATIAPAAESFARALRDLGWVGGQSLAIEHRYADGNLDRLPALVAEVVQAKPDVIVVSGSVAMRAAQRTTRTIPIVFVVLSDPVTAGFVTASLVRAGT